MSAAATTPLAYYSRLASKFHWVAAFPMIASIGAVLVAQRVPKEQRGEWMFRHKSMGLLASMIIAPRFIYRIVNRIQGYNVKHLTVNATWENKAGDLSHIALYGFMTIMPITGIMMGYYGGKGLPFFYTTFIPNETPPDGILAKQSYEIHKVIGSYGKYLIPLHVGAGFMHAARGQQIFSRINPFRSS